MIERACQALVTLQRSGCVRTLSVNVSLRQFLQRNFVVQVRDTLDRTAADLNQLIFEVTEGLLIEDWKTAVVSMQEFVALGLRLTIDDFSTDYSSLAYLKRLPIYDLKIDRSFVQGIPDDPGDRAIVPAIVSVARHLALHVVADGVETLTQLHLLASIGCECMQGYLFGKPMPLQRWLEEACEHA